MMIRFFLSLILCLLAAVSIAADDKHGDDPHYTESGFFDIHICNWPDRAPFYLTLYRTEQYKNIKSVIIKNAEGEIIGELNPEKYRERKNKNKLTERVLIAHIPVLDGSKDGWFVAEVLLKDGERHVARDLVIHWLMPHVTGNYPEPEADDILLPRLLHWHDVDGAYWYQVFIRDMWDDEKLIYKSRLLPFPELDLPEGIIKPGGYYSWKVHARDVNNHPELGEFNAGSQSNWIKFSVADDW
jgi:hypothetical protein